jgi:hypothetical protein
MGGMSMATKAICTAVLAVLLTCSISAFAGPTFESVIFGKQSTHCDAKSARATVVPDGSGISVLFDKMRAEAGTKNHGHDRIRCDVTLKLATPLEAPSAIQMDVRGMVDLTGEGAASATLTMHGRKQTLNFDAMDDAGFQRVIVNLPKGAKKVDLTFEASAKGKFPDSTALIAIDSLDIGVESRP